MDNVVKVAVCILAAAYCYVAIRLRRVEKRMDAQETRLKTALDTVGTGLNGVENLVKDLRDELNREDPDLDTLVEQAEALATRIAQINPNNPTTNPDLPPDTAPTQPSDPFSSNTAPDTTPVDGDPSGGIENEVDTQADPAQP